MMVCLLFIWLLPTAYFWGEFNRVDGISWGNLGYAALWPVGLLLAIVGALRGG